MSKVELRLYDKLARADDSNLSDSFDSGAEEGVEETAEETRLRVARE